MYQNFNLEKWTSIYRNGHIYSKVFSRTVAILILRNKPIASFRFIVYPLCVSVGLDSIDELKVPLLNLFTSAVRQS